MRYALTHRYRAGRRIESQRTIEVKPKMTTPRFAAAAAPVLALGLMTIAVACGGDATPTDIPDPTATPAPSAPTEAPEEQTAASTGPTGYNSPAYTQSGDTNGYISGIFEGYGDTSGFAGDSFNAAPFDTQLLHGKPVVINFWFPSCPPCRAELPEFESAYQEYGPPGGGDIAFVGVQQLGLDSIQDGIDLFAELGVTFSGLPDNGSHIQLAYEIFSYPTTVFLDRNHNEFRKWQGALTHDTLIEILDELSASSEVAPADDAPTDTQIAAEATAIEPERDFAPAQVFAGFGDATGFTGESFHHGMFDTRQLEGTPMVINFWYPSCPPCRAEMPNLEDAYKRSQDAGTNIAFVGVQGMAIDTASQGIEFLDTLGVTYPGIPDMTGDIHWAYEVTAAPTTYFLDSEHNIAAVHYGYIRWDDLEEKLALIAPDGTPW